MEKPETAAEKRTLVETFERAWGQALLAVSNAEEEATRAAQRVAELAGWSQDEVKRHARELTERLAAQREALECNVEEGVRKALGHLKVPRREELQAFEERLAKVAERIEALGQRK